MERLTNECHTSEAACVRIMEWLRQEGGWVPAYRLFQWTKAELGLSKGQTRTDVRRLMSNGRIERRVFDPADTPDAPSRYLILRDRWREIRIADNAKNS